MENFNSLQFTRDIRDKQSIELLQMNTEQILEYFKKSTDQYSEMIEQNNLLSATSLNDKG